METTAQTASSVKTILVLAANPKGTSPLRLGEEVREIQEGLRRSHYRDRFRIEQRWAVTATDVRRALLDCHPQIVHFSGHGVGRSLTEKAPADARKVTLVTQGIESEPEGLLFEDATGHAKQVSAEAIAALFSLFADELECVVLNACYSATQANAIARYVPYVVGMEQAIGDRAAIEFAVGFYDALGAGREIDFAYALGCQAIQLAGIPEHLTPILTRSQSLSAHPSNAPQKKHQLPVLPKLISTQIITIGLVSTTLVAAVFLGFPSQLSERLKGFNANKCFNQAKKEDKLAVAIAPIQKYNLTAEAELPFLQNQISDYLTKNNTTAIKVCPPISRPITNADDAINLGRELNASIVVWGRQSAAEVELRVTTAHALKNPVVNLTTLTVPLSDGQKTKLIQDIPRLVNIMTAYASSEIFRQESKKSDILPETLRLAQLSSPDLSQEYMAYIFSQAYFFAGLLYKPDDYCDTDQQACEQALDFFKKATQIDPKFYNAFTNQSFLEQGLLLENMNRLDEAIKVYSEYLETHHQHRQPSNDQIAVSARGHRANLYLRQGDVQKALAEIKIVCQDTNNLHYVFWLSVKGRAELLAEDYTAAQNTFQKAQKAIEVKGGDAYTSERILQDLNQLVQENPDLNEKVQPIVSLF